MVDPNADWHVLTMDFTTKWYDLCLTVRISTVDYKVEYENV